jgi:hypothetical protein
MTDLLRGQKEEGIAIFVRRVDMDVLVQYFLQFLMQTKE